MNLKDIIRRDEIQKNPPPYKLEMSTPGHIEQNAHLVKERLCRVFCRDDLKEYKEKIDKKVKERLENLGINV